MARSRADFVQETSTTTGTGTYDLAGAATGYQGFVAAVGDGATVRYSVTDGVDWEVCEGVVTDAATDTLSRATVLASSNAGAAVNWGSGTKTISLVMTADELTNIDRETFQIVVYDFNATVGTGDGKAYLHVTEDMDGMNLVSVHAEVITAGTTGTLDIQVRNVTQAVDMLTTKLTIDSGETGSDTAATAAVIDTANDDVAENDLLAIDIDAVPTTAPVGLIVTLKFRAP